MKDFFLARLGGFAGRAAAEFLGERMMASNGLTILPSEFDSKETMDRLQTEIESRGLTVFARIDHAAGAEAIGLKLPPTELLIFGNAKTEMQAQKSGSRTMTRPGLPRGMVSVRNDRIAPRCRNRGDEDSIAHSAPDPPGGRSAFTLLPLAWRSATRR